VTVGFALIYAVGGFFDMSFGASLLIGGYFGYVCYRLLSLNLMLALVISGLVAGGFGVFLEGFLFRPLARRNAPSLIFFIASLGILIAIQSLITLIFGSEMKVMHPGAYPTIPLFGMRITQAQAGIFLISLVILLGVFFVFHRTDFGRKVRAVADDRYLGEVIGLPVRRTLIGIFFVGAALAGIAGVLLGLELPLEPSLGLKAVLWAVVASIIGGVGNIGGAILGAYLVGAMENIAVIVFPAEWKTAILFIILVLFLLLRPRGILGVETRKVEG